MIQCSPRSTGFVACPLLPVSRRFLPCLSASARQSAASSLSPAFLPPEILHACSPALALSPVPAGTGPDAAMHTTAVSGKDTSLPDNASQSVNAGQPDAASDAAGSQSATSSSSTADRTATGNGTATSGASSDLQSSQGQGRFVLGEELPKNAAQATAPPDRQAQATPGTARDRTRTKAATRRLPATVPTAAHRAVPTPKWTGKNSFPPTGNRSRASSR